jgi:Co/Zn/Cd efflux system component
METDAQKFLQTVEKDLKDWEDAAAFLGNIRTVKMDGQIYSRKDFAESMLLGILVNLGLSAAKISAGFVCHSFALVADS